MAVIFVRQFINKANYVGGKHAAQNSAKNSNDKVNGFWYTYDVFRRISQVRNQKRVRHLRTNDDNIGSRRPVDSLADFYSISMNGILHKAISILF